MDWTILAVALLLCAGVPLRNRLIRRWKNKSSRKRRRP